MDRRTWLARLVQGMGLAVAGVAGLPAIIAAVSPVIRHRREVNNRLTQWQPLGTVEQFPIGQVTQAKVDVPRDDWAEALRRKGVYVWRRSEREVVVFSRNCTDLSCPVTYDEGSGVFVCPCHGGIFDHEGNVMAGPPSRPLYRYANRVRDGVLEIDLRSLPAIA